MHKIAPSILSCDFANLAREVEAVKKAGADLLHVDVMDGHFVPNISIGIPVVASLRKCTDMFLDVHLMISRPLEYIDQFAAAGADLISFHLESESDPSEAIARIKSHGIKVGMSISPQTPTSALEPFIPMLDMVLIMTIQPGFGGQKLMPEALPKIRQTAQLKQRLNPELWLEVDGGVNSETASDVAMAGAEILVAGSAVFGKPDYAQAIEQLRAAATGRS